MKRLVSVTVVLLLIFAGAIFAFGASKKEVAPSKVLNIWTWEGYAPDEVVKRFEEETGIKVNVSYYSDNGELIAN